MAFKKAPEQDTYSTVEFPVFKDENHRGLTGSTGSGSGIGTQLDSFLQNIIIESTTNRLTKEKTYSLTKRPGTKQAIAGSASLSIVGMYFWPGASSTGRLFIVKQDAATTPSDLDIISYDPPSGTTDSTWTVNTTYDKALPGGYTLANGIENYKVSFTEFLYDSGAVDLVISDELGGTLVKINQAGTLATCTDADYPDGLIDIQYIDGYLVGIKPGTADVYNSDLNDPFLWTAGNFLATEQNPDTAIGLAVHHNFLVVLGNKSVEFLYNAGISTGSPFQRNTTYSKNIGLIGGLEQYGDRVLFIGQMVNGEVNLYLIEESQIVAIGGTLVPKFMSRYFYGSGNAPYSIERISTSIITCPKTGYSFYSLATDGTQSYMLNLSNLTWTNWSFQSNAMLFAELAQSFFTKAPRRFFSLFYSGRGATNNGIVALDPDLFQDVGTNYTIKIRTEKEDFETMNQKYMYRLSLYTDRDSGATVSVSYTDDDYTTYSTPVSVSLNQELPSITRLGRFRQRALVIEGTFNADFTLYKVEVDINKGVT